MVRLSFVPRQSLPHLRLLVTASEEAVTLSHLSKFSYVTSDWKEDLLMCSFPELSHSWLKIKSLVIPTNLFRGEKKTHEYMTGWCLPCYLFSLMGHSPHPPKVSLHVTLSAGSPWKLVATCSCIWMTVPLKRASFVKIWLIKDSRERNERCPVVGIRTPTSHGVLK